MSELLDPITLTGRHVQLEPLRVEHVDGLVAASTIGRDTYGYTDVPGDPDAMRHYVERLVADHADAKVLRSPNAGSTPASSPVARGSWSLGGGVAGSDPDEIEIGGTWLASTAQRTSVNTEAKYLLLSHAFERGTCGGWRSAPTRTTHVAASRSSDWRRAFEGVLRNHRLRYNTAAPEPRNTAVYSITDADWPEVKRSLEQRLADSR